MSICQENKEKVGIVHFSNKLASMLIIEKLSFFGQFISWKLVK